MPEECHGVHASNAVITSVLAGSEGSERAVRRWECMCCLPACSCDGDLHLGMPQALVEDAR